MLFAKFAQVYKIEEENHDFLKVYFLIDNKSYDFLVSRQDAVKMNVGMRLRMIMNQVYGEIP